MTAGEETFHVVARNSPEHARNAIHTDAGARAAGYERALVAGVTSYAYCCHVAIARFGPPWVTNGTAEVRLRAPVFDGDELLLPCRERADGGIDVTVTAARSTEPLVEMQAWPGPPPDDTVGGTGRGAPSPLETLTPVEIRLEGEYGAEYGLRAGDPDPGLPPGLVHPAVFVALANQVVQSQLARGAWVHTRSRVRHYAAGWEGADAVVTGALVLRELRRSGERATASLEVSTGGTLLATLLHEAIVDLSAR
ncbi:MAG TPA: hypothetical protein VKU92_11475 [Acidimicrobiales bacterium]|nr:hypothetical protein [Acidimicrobiales bacterium]